MLAHAAPSAVDPRVHSLSISRGQRHCGRGPSVRSLIRLHVLKSLPPRRIILVMRWAMNDSMASILLGMGSAPSLETLPRRLASIAKAGVRRSDDSVRLVRSEVKTPPPAGFDDYRAEAWSNKIYLDSTLPASDPAWRTELAGWGVAVAQTLLCSARDLFDLPVQAHVSLQSAPGEEDPETDFASGALHLYCIRSRSDDDWSQLQHWTQPVLVLTIP